VAAVTDPHDESHWSTRYYQIECPDLRVTLKTDGPDGRSDPAEGTTQPCILDGHDRHPLVRISPDRWAELTADDDDDIDRMELS
jgi:hypothetical protein